MLAVTRPQRFIMQPDRSGCREVVQAMRAGGYFDRLMSAGPELNRVKAYVQAMAARESWTAASPRQYPDYPMFPGLRHIPFRQLDDIPGAVLLQQSVDLVTREWQALNDADYLRYAPQSMDKLWQVHLLQHMGVSLQGWSTSCPRTQELIHRLPGVCLTYPWGDALFSVHHGQSHLRAHCSVDNLRVRCHLALRVPPGCSIRVDEETRSWQDGQALLFEDSFEHEVWNRSDQQRTVFIIDFWHPDLTAVEVDALTAGFCQSSVRRLFLNKRLSAIPAVQSGFREFLEQQIDLQDQDPLIRRHWGT
jgi:hypothetical protein